MQQRIVQLSHHQRVVGVPKPCHLPTTRIPLGWWTCHQTHTARTEHACRTAAPAAPLDTVPATSAAVTSPIPDSTQVQREVLDDILSGNRHMLRDKQGRVSLKNLTRKQLEQWCMSIPGEVQPEKRALQVWRWMYADGAWVGALEETLGRQNGMANRFIEQAASTVTCDGGLELQQVVRAQDGTRKLVFKLTAGEAAGGSVEAVLIPVVRSAGQRARITLCVSTQVGCAMNCQFCFTGRAGLLGNLTTAQIIEQVVEARRFMARENDTTPMTNLVFMGMGEPLHNPEAVADAIEIMSCPLGLHMSHNKVTVSTVGLIPEIRKFASRTRAQLAVSLHATTDEVRDWIVPINRRYPLAQLMATLRELYPIIQRPSSSPSPSPSSSSMHDPQSLTINQQGPLLPTQLSGAELQGGVGAASSHDPHHVDGHIQGSQSLAESSGPARRHLSRKRVPARGTGEGDGGEGEDRLHGTLLIAYTMLRGINDTAEDAHRLLSLLEGVAAKVNLIEFNSHEGTPFLPSTSETVTEFRNILIQGGRVCTIRSSRGDDEMAACGQLGDAGLSWKPAPMIEPPARFQELIQQQQEQRRQVKACGCGGQPVAA